MTEFTESTNSLVVASGSDKAPSSSEVQVTITPETIPEVNPNVALQDLQSFQYSHSTTSDYIGGFVSWSIDESMNISHESLKAAFEAHGVNTRLLPNTKTHDQAFSAAVSRWNNIGSPNQPKGWRLGMIPKKDVPSHLRDKGYMMCALTSTNNIKDDVLVVKLGKDQALTLSFLHSNSETYFNVEGRKDSDWGMKGEAICEELKELYSQAFNHDRIVIHSILTRFVQWRGLTVNNTGSSSSLIFVPGKYLAECEAIEALIANISKSDSDGNPLSNFSLIPQYTLINLSAVQKQIENQIKEEINELEKEALEFNAEISDKDLKINASGDFSKSIERKIDRLSERKQRLAAYIAKFPNLASSITSVDKVLTEIAASYDALVAAHALIATKSGATINRKSRSAKSRLFAEV
jgi:hypothetical protein